MPITAIIKTARPLAFAALVAVSSIGLAPFVVEQAAVAANGNGGGRGGDGGAAGGGGGYGSDEIYEVFRRDALAREAAARRGANCISANCRPERPPQEFTSARKVCASGNIRIVRDVNGDPLRYLCMPAR